jgi:hypothetical protein
VCVVAVVMIAGVDVGDGVGANIVSVSASLVVDADDGEFWIMMNVLL